MRGRHSRRWPWKPVGVLWWPYCHGPMVRSCRVVVCYVCKSCKSLGPEGLWGPLNLNLPSTEAWIEKPSFGKPLEEHLAVSGREIAFPIEACVTMLLECGMQEEVSKTQWLPLLLFTASCQCLANFCSLLSSPPHLWLSCSLSNAGDLSLRVCCLKFASRAIA